MKKKLLLLLVFAILPFTTFAKTYYDGYETKNLKDTLAAENIELENKSYKENDKQAVIYMFRGQGCYFCRNFLTFLSSISKDYGKYFKLVSFEVWYNEQNSALFNKVGALNGEDLEKLGVPYILIGEQKFNGFNESFADSIKKKKKKEYEKHGTDVFDRLAKAEEDGTLVIPARNNDTNKDGDTTKETSNYSNEENNTNATNSTTSIIAWNIIFIGIATAIIVVMNNKNTERVLEALNNKKVDEVEKEEKKEEVKKLSTKEKKTKKTKK